MVATFEQPNHVTTHPDATAYKNAIEASIKVNHEVAGQFAPHEAAAPDMTIVVDDGRFMYAGGLVIQPQQTTVAFVAPINNPRIDRVVIDNVTGAISIVSGVENVAPVAPAIPIGKQPCCQVLLINTPATTVITNTMISDERVGPSDNGFEAGNWTPILIDNSFTDDEGQTYSEQTGHYMKIGNIVFISGVVWLNSLGALSAAGTCQIKGLPYTSKSNSRPGGINCNAGGSLNITAGTNISGEVVAGSNRVALHLWNSSLGTIGLTVGQFSAGGLINFHGHYFI